MIFSLEGIQINGNYHVIICFMGSNAYNYLFLKGLLHQLNVLSEFMAFSWDFNGTLMAIFYRSVC